MNFNDRRDGALHDYAVYCTRPKTGRQRGNRSIVPRLVASPWCMYYSIIINIVINIIIIYYQSLRARNTTWYIEYVMYTHHIAHLYYIM